MKVFFATLLLALFHLSDAKFDMKAKLLEQRELQNGHLQVCSLLCDDGCVFGAFPLAFKSESTSSRMILY